MKYLLVFLLLFFISGCSNPFIENETTMPSSLTRTEALLPYADPITIDDATKALKDNGLTVEKTDAINPSDFIFEAVTPVVYKMNKSNHYLLVYDYKTIARLKETGLGSEYAFYFFNHKYFPDEEPWVDRPFTAKNILLVVRINADLLARNGTYLIETYKTFSKARYDLNDGVSFTYAGQSKNFDAKVKVSAFSYWYKDEKGCNHLEQESQQKWEVRYLGTNPESIHDLHYSLSVSGGSGISGGSNHGSDIFKKEGNQYYLRLSENDHSCPDKDTVYILKIKLNNQKYESLQLRNIQPTLAMFMNESFHSAFLKSIE